MHFFKLQDDKNVAHLTHVSEMEKKCESLARITAILKDVIQNKVLPPPSFFIMITLDFQIVHKSNVANILIC